MTAFRVNDLVAAVRHSHKSFPTEACGVLVGRRGSTLLSIRSTAGRDNTVISFTIADSEIAAIEQDLAGSNEAVRGCFHSHVFGRAIPSKRDAAARKRRGDLWLIYSLRFRQLRLFEWNGDRFSRRRFRVVRNSRSA